MTAADERRVTARTGISLAELCDLIESGDNRSWRARAACAGVDPGLFFPVRGASTEGEPAKAVCATCPVAAPCLASALREHETIGVFGGTSERSGVAAFRELGARPERAFQGGWFGRVR